MNKEEPRRNKDYRGITIDAKEAGENFGESRRKLMSNSSLDNR
jgi:hypothetical protein